MDMPLVPPFWSSDTMVFPWAVQLMTERGGGIKQTPGPEERLAELTQQQLGKRREGGKH